MKVPVTLAVDPATKELTISVGTPPTSALLLKEAGKEKGSGTPKQAKIGNLSLDACIRVARMKEADSGGRTLKARVEGKDPRDVQRAVDAGQYDAKVGE